MADAANVAVPDQACDNVMMKAEKLKGKRKTENLALRGGLVVE